MMNNNHIPSLNGHTLEYFGLGGLGEFDSPKAQSVRKKLKYNIDQGKITLLVGQHEAGKTMLTRHLKRAHSKAVNFIDIPTLDEEKIKMGTILNGVVDVLGTKGARRDMLARSKQAVRLLGHTLVNEHKPSCIILDNTPDRLHLNTMNAIKLLMEQDFAGYSPVVSIIILCWPEFVDRLENRNDIKHRVQQIRLDENHGWFTLPDRLRYLQDVFGKAITPAARKRIANLYALPGDINAYVVKMMEKAEQAGYNRLDDQVVKPSLKERYNAMKERYGHAYSLSVIADKADVGKSTVQLAVSSEPDTPSTRKVAAAMDALQEQFASGDNHNSQRKAS